MSDACRERRCMDPYHPHVREPNCFTLDFYLQHDGYDGLKKALAMPAGPGHRDGQGLGAARPRRRRLSRPA